MGYVYFSQDVQTPPGNLLETQSPGFSLETRYVDIFPRHVVSRVHVANALGIVK